MKKLLSLAVLCLTATAANAQVAASCDQPHDLDRYQLLRRLSLDLRGHVPSLAEYEALDQQSVVPQTTVAAYIASDDFRRAMRGYHEDLFWPNVSNVQLSNTNANLVQKAMEPAMSLASTARRNQFRGDPDLTTTLHGASCGDYEQTHFLAGGGFRPDPAFIYTEVQGGKTVKQEGWRMVVPYWDPAGTPVKVCAFDAQENATATIGTKTYSCNDSSTNGRAECGCGPNLTFCYGSQAKVAAPILASMREQLGRAVDTMTTGGRPYTDLILAKTADVNGPIAQYKSTLSKNYSLSRIYALADPAEELATGLTFNDATTWKSVDRGPMHAGVTTLPGYLLRFQTNRGRANRFRIDFECASFVPPSDVEAVGTQGCQGEGTDLTKRCTCRYCHRMLEPLAAHWGQFSEAGTTLLTPATFPRTNSACVGSGGALCNRFYVTAADGDNPGSLLSYQYADAQHADITAALAGGPRKRAQEIVADGTFARCAVKRVFRNFVKRDMETEGDDTSELALMSTLADGFKTNQYSLPWLVEQVVSLPQYRRVR